MPNYKPPPIRLTARTRLNPLSNVFTVSSIPQHSTYTEPLLITEVLNHEEENSIEEGSNYYDSGINLQEKYNCHPLTSKPTRTEVYHVRNDSLPNTTTNEELNYACSAFKYPDNTHMKPKLNQLKYYSKRTRHKSVEHYQFKEPTSDTQYELYDNTPKMIQPKDYDWIQDKQTDHFQVTSTKEHPSQSPVYDNIHRINLDYRPLTKVKIFERKKADKLKLLQHDSFTKPSNHIIHTEINTDAATQTTHKNSPRGRFGSVVYLKKSSRWSSGSPERYCTQTSTSRPSKLSTIAIVYK